MCELLHIQLHVFYRKKKSAVLTFLSFLVFLVSFSNVHGQTNSTYEVVRLNNSKPIIDQDMFDELGVEGEGENINGPSLIRIPDWISPSNRADPSAVYYLYFGHHVGDYIRMAWAADITGPWHLYRAGSNVSLGSRGVLDNGNQDIDVGNGIVIEENHLASPDVHVDDENQRIILYFHSGSSTFFNGNEMNGQFTWAATSPFGLDFNGNIEPVRLSTSYVRTFEDGGHLYAFDNSASPKRALDINNPWTPTLDYYSGSTIPALWESRSGNFTQEPIEENLGLGRADLRVRHTAVRVVGDELQVFYTRRGDSPERVMMSTVDLSVGDFENWEFSFPPAPLLNAVSGWEGGQFDPEPSETASAPENVNQLRDPFVFEDEDGSLYLIYAGSGEDALGIAAMSSPQQQIDVLNPIEDAYVRGGASADINYGSDDTLEVKQGSNSNFFRKTYLNFDVSNPEDVDAAVLRLYASRSRDINVTLYATSSAWGEDTITWNNAPLEGAEIATVVMGPEDQWYEWDVSSYLSGLSDESVSFVLYDENADNRTIRFSSKEGDHPPELKVLYNSEQNNPTVSNLALSKSVVQSTTAFGGLASRAVDGNTSGVWRDGSTTHTSNSTQPWWQVDLGVDSTVQNVVLFNRTDSCCTSRLSNFYVLVSDTPFGERTLDELLNDSSIFRSFHSSLSGSSLDIPFNVSSARYVRVQLQGLNALSLAEVQVMGFAR